MVALGMGQPALEHDDESANTPRTNAAGDLCLDDRLDVPTQRGPLVQGALDLTDVHLVADERRSDLDHAVLE
jgi:hypothetical protein